MHLEKKHHKYIQMPYWLRCDRELGISELVLVLYARQQSPQIHTRASKIKVSVRGGLLLGGVEDVLVLLDKPKRHHQRVTHLLSLLNSPLDWTELETPQGPSLAMYVCG